MSEDSINNSCPTLVALLRESRDVTVEELRRVVAATLGDDAAATVQWVGENDTGGAYLQWRNGATPQHLGTFNQPYISRGGVANIGEPIRWRMREEIPPVEPDFCAAWMAHNAWLYVDALNIGSTRDERDHRGFVFRVASWFIDHRCVLLWLPGYEPKRVALPTPQTTAGLRQGRWPD